MIKKSLAMPAALLCGLLVSDGLLAATSSTQVSPAEFWLRLILIHSTQTAHRQRLKDTRDSSPAIKLTSEEPAARPAPAPRSWQPGS